MSRNASSSNGFKSVLLTKRGVGTHLPPSLLIGIRRCGGQVVACLSKFPPLPPSPPPFLASRDNKYINIGIHHTPLEDRLRRHNTRGGTHTFLHSSFLFFVARFVCFVLPSKEGREGSRKSENKLPRETPDTTIPQGARPTPAPSPPQSTTRHRLAATCRRKQSMQPLLPLLFHADIFFVLVLLRLFVCYLRLLVLLRIYGWLPFLPSFFFMNSSLRETGNFSAAATTATTLPASLFPFRRKFRTNKNQQERRHPTTRGKGSGRSITWEAIFSPLFSILFFPLLARAGAGHSGGTQHITERADGLPTPFRRRRPGRGRNCRTSRRAPSVQTHTPHRPAAWFSYLRPSLPYFPLGTRADTSVPRPDL